MLVVPHIPPDKSPSKVSSNTIVKNLHVLYTNADQFINKHDLLTAQIAGKNPDIIFISEMLPNVTSTNISLALFTIYLVILFT